MQFIATQKLRRTGFFLSSLQLEHDRGHARMKRKYVIDVLATLVINKEIYINFTYSKMTTVMFIIIYRD